MFKFPIQARCFFYFVGGLLVQFLKRCFPKKYFNFRANYFAIHTYIQAGPQRRHHLVSKECARSWWPFRVLPAWGRHHILWATSFLCSVFLLEVECFYQITRWTYSKASISSYLVCQDRKRPNASTNVNRLGAAQPSILDLHALETQL